MYAMILNYRVGLCPRFGVEVCSSGGTLVFIMIIVNGPVLNSERLQNKLILRALQQVAVSSSKEPVEFLRYNVIGKTF